MGTSVFEGIIAAIVPVDEKEPIRNALFLKTHGPVRLGKFGDTIEIHNGLAVLKGPAALVRWRLCGAYAKETLENIPPKDLGLHNFKYLLDVYRREPLRSAESRIR